MISASPGAVSHAAQTVQVPNRRSGTILSPLLLPLATGLLGTLGLLTLVPTGPDEWQILQQIRELRAAGNLLEARDLAAALLADHPTRDLLRQNVHYEFGMTYRDAREFAEALPIFATIVAEYPPEEFDGNLELVVLDDAWFQYGDLLVRDGQFRAGHTRLLDIRARWPESNVFARALQYASRALIQEELADWQPGPGLRREGTIDNHEEIEANLTTLIDESPEPEELAAAMLDVVNYFNSIAVPRCTPRAETLERIIPILEQMLALVPEAHATARAKLDLADALLRTEPDRALALLAEAQAAAEELQDASLWNDAQFLVGSIHSQQNRPAAARAAWELLLQEEQSLDFAGDVQLLIAVTYTREDDCATAATLLGELAANPKHALDLRLCAQLHQVVALRKLADWDAARRILAEIIANYPDTVFAAAARKLERTVYPRTR